MTEQQEETIREEYFLLHNRNTHNTHILNRIYTRYLKCIQRDKQIQNRAKPENQYNGGHLG